MRTEKINLREVNVFDLMDEPVLLPTTFVMDLGNGIYVKYRDIERQDLGRKIFMSEKEQKELVMDERELSMFISLFEETVFLPGLLQNAIMEYLNKKLKNLKKEEDGNSNK